MSEFLEAHPDLPRLPMDLEAFSSVDLKIADALQAYMSTLQNGHRAEFRDVESLSKKVDVVCWEWSQSPETWSAAVELRSLHVIRTLEDTVMREDEVDRSYKLPVIEGFWSKVDERTYANLVKFIFEKGNVVIPDFEIIRHRQAYPIYALGDYVIARVSQAGGHMVDYTAVPIES